MTPIVKICGLTDRAAVLAAIESGADAVGFVFAQSVRQLSPRQAAVLGEGLPAGVRRVAVMLHPSIDEWHEVRDVFRPQVLQTDAADFAYLDVPEEIERWPVFREGECRDADVLPATFLYEGRQSGQGQTVEWRRAAAFARRGRMILAGGLNAGNVAEAIREASPWGVDVSSAVESAPGQKDAAKIAAFINAARAAVRP
jgi:phosphoribosylanthranilate isomerase